MKITTSGKTPKPPALWEAFKTNTMQIQQHSIVIKPCSVAELAALYGVSVKVMRRWLVTTEPCTGKRNGRFYTALQVAVILQKLGIPGVQEIEEQPIR